MPGAGERGRVPWARLSGTAASTSSSLNGRVDVLRGGREDTLGGGSFKERSENLVPPPLFSLPSSPAFAIAELTDLIRAGHCG